MSLIGVDGHVVEVEADLAQGLPGLTVTGLPDAALGEAHDRVCAAVVNSGHAWPQKRITLGLSPASLPKRGRGFDLALAAAILAADGAVPPVALIGRVLLGELGLDGRVRSVRGVLPAVLTAVRAGFGQVIVPMGNLAEARLLPGVQADGVATLRGLVALLRGEPLEEACPSRPRAVGVACPGAGHARRRRPGTRSHGDGRGSSWRTPCLPGRPAGFGQDDGGRAHAGAAPAPGAQGSPGGHCRALGRRHVADGRAVGPQPALPGSASHFDCRLDRRWRQRGGPTGGRLAGPPRGALPGRGPGVGNRGPRRAKATARVRSVEHHPGRWHCGLPGPVHPAARGQPVPVRQGRP